MPAAVSVRNVALPVIDPKLPESEGAPGPPGGGYDPQVGDMTPITLVLPTHAPLKNFKQKESYKRYLKGTYKFPPDAPKLKKIMPPPPENF